MRKATVVAAALTPALVLLPGPAPAAPAQASAAVAPPTSMVSAKSDRGSLRVVAQGVPAGRSAKITVAGKKYRKKLPAAGKLRNLRPGTYRVWAAPIVADGGTASVANLPLRVRVRTHKPAVLRLQFAWNPKNDSYPPSPASGLEVVEQGVAAVALRWENGQAPDLQGVEVRRRQGSEPPASLDEGRVVDVSRFATSVVDTDLRAHTAYSYSVFMVDTAGNASKPATLTTRTLGVALQLGAGTSHTCALVEDTDAQGDLSALPTPDLLSCWGDNAHAQLGRGTGADASIPADVALADVVQVATGSDHTCARQRGGTLRCWGRNDYGQVAPSSGDVTRPVQVSLPGVIDVAVGGDHTCAVLDSGQVRCWGRNDHGQVGAPASESQRQPVSVPGITNAVSVTAGYAHTCAVLDSGQVRCWGRNDHGQLGNTSTADSATPVKPGLGVVESLTAGVFHTCAQLNDLSLWCWGGNDYGQVGDSSTSDRLSPVQVPLTGVQQVSAGAYHTCAVNSVGVARCWGRNSGGRLGDGSTVDRLSPTRVVGVTGVGSIAAGAHHTCAITTAGTFCWGSNANGQLGTGDQTSAPRPQPVYGL
jgi:alpha-tubulin suppressor-like RCC1 family protein